MKPQILVTGGAGFIGSHTCKQLAAAGLMPVTFDNLSTGHRDAVKWGPLVEGDIRAPEALVATLRLHQPAAVIHFAASAYVGESVVDPAVYYRNNVEGTRNLLEACRTTGVRAIIFSSSCATYGTPDRTPITEDTPQAPINPYGRTKLIGEQMLDDYRSAYGLSFAALRYFNACGADPEGDIGERHTPETHLIPRALMAGAGLLPFLEVFGTDYPTPDGTCIRDYVHVTDLAQAHVLATQRLLAGGDSLKVNLGSGKGHSIRQVLDAIAQVIGHPVPAVYRGRRPGDPAELYADVARARDELRFVAQHSDLDTIIRTALPWFSEQVRHAG
ncbi:UDP-glucose 4-epimerase GalE [Devosia sp.]|uniref:UDP-glucose 4-epimerase GalE n=1 Tax=Devosia sp. TaxID=1871048 RepID=UPI003A945324